MKLKRLLAEAKHATRQDLSPRLLFQNLLSLVAEIETQGPMAWQVANVQNVCGRAIVKAKEVPEFEGRTSSRPCGLSQSTWTPPNMAR